MRTKDDILHSVRAQDVTNESTEQYSIRVMKAILEVLIDIRDTQT